MEIESTCEAPDPNPHPPRSPLPALSCDTHTHVFGPSERFPCGPGRGYTPPDAPFDRLEQLHRALGVERGIVVQPSVYGTDNSALLDALARGPQRWRGVVALGPDATERQLDELDAAGVRGIRVNLVDRGGMPFASMDEVVTFAGRISPRGWHVELLVHVHELPEIEMLGRMPTDVVVGHFGYMHVSNGVDHPGFARFLDVLEGQGA